MPYTPQKLSVIVASLTLTNIQFIELLTSMDIKTILFSILFSANIVWSASKSKNLLTLNEENWRDILTGKYFNLPKTKTNKS